MRIRRRQVLAGLGAAAAIPVRAARAAATLRLRPGGLDVAYTVDADAGVTRVSFAGEGRPLSVPGVAERMLALPIAGRQVLACSTVLPGAQPGAPGVLPDPRQAQRLVSLIGWDDARLRILGVESLSWRGPDRRGLALRVVAVPDDVRLRLLYDAVHAGRHESWTDILAWRSGAPLASAPLRPVLAGTLQARVATVRARVLLLLAGLGSSLELGQLGATGILDPLGDG